MLHRVRLQSEKKIEGQTYFLIKNDGVVEAVCLFLIFAFFDDSFDIVLFSCI